MIVTQFALLGNFSEAIILFIIKSIMLVQTITVQLFNVGLKTTELNQSPWIYDFAEEQLYLCLQTKIRPYGFKFTKYLHILAPYIFIILP